MRKIRVLCADPYATDSSSDEEELNIPKKKKRACTCKEKVFLREILVPDLAIDQVMFSPVEMFPDSSSREEVEAPNQYYRNFDLTKHQGVRLTKSGKGKAEKSLRWLGTYNSQAEAENAYDNEKLGYQSLTKKAMHDTSDREGDKLALITKKLSSIYSSKPDSLVLSKKDTKRSHNSSMGDSNNESKADVTVNDSLKSLVKKNNKYLGVRCRGLGRWSAEIKCGKSRQYLGSFKTAEDAADAYDKARMERDSNKRNRKVDFKEVCKNVIKDNVMKSQSHFESDHHIEKKLFQKSPFAPMRSPKMECFEKSRFEFESLDLTCEAEISGVTTEGNIEREDSYTGVARNYVMPNLLLANVNMDDPDQGIINSYGQLIGEYNRLDDQLWFCSREEDDDDDENYGSCSYPANAFFEDLVCDYKPSQFEQNREASLEVDMRATSVGWL